MVRRLLGGSGLAGVLPAIVGLTAAIGVCGTAVAKDFVVAAWGDPYEEGWRKSLVPEFEKKYGVKIVWVQGFSSQTLAKLKAQQANPQIDVAMMDDGPFFQAANSGLIEKLDMAKVPNAKDLVEMAFEPKPHGVYFGVAGTGMYYNSKIFKEKGWAPPTSFNDLFDPKFAKRVTTHTIQNSAGLMVLLAMTKLAGGSIPDNMDPGFKKMQELAKQVVTFDQFGETAVLFQQEAVLIGTWNTDRVANLKLTGAPIEFVYPKEGIWAWKDAIGVIAGRPKEMQDLGHAFINMMLTKQEQENTAKYIGFIPMHKEVTGYGRETLKDMNFIDWGELAKHRPIWTERWNKEVERRQ